MGQGLEKSADFNRVPTVAGDAADVDRWRLCVLSRSWRGRFLLAGTATPVGRARSFRSWAHRPTSNCDHSASSYVEGVAGLADRIEGVADGLGGGHRGTQLSERVERGRSEYAAEMVGGGGEFGDGDVG